MTTTAPVRQRPLGAVVAQLPAEPGVYRFRDARDRVLYVGRASDLRHRVGSYWGDLGERRHLVRMIPQIERIEALVCASPHEAAWLERNLIERDRPRWNRSIGGQEVPVYLVLDPRPRAPRLFLEHDHLVDRRTHGLRFGPYLGGNRVRAAIDALERILPLAYTGAGITGGERDLGRHRGVSGKDRGWVLDAVAAVLARHPDAVGRAEAALRDLWEGAAATQRYELAAQIREEAAALSWVTGVQRVTDDAGGDGQVAGWADGILVEFALRGGRVVTWAAGPASAEAAASKLAATPPAWSTFVRRNAELAAALSRPSGTDRRD